MILIALILFFIGLSQDDFKGFITITAAVLILLNKIL